MPLGLRAVDFSLEGGFGEPFLLQEGYGTAGKEFLFFFAWEKHDAAVGGFSASSPRECLGLPLSFWCVFAPCFFSTVLKLCVISAFAVWAVSPVCHRLLTVFFLTLKNCSALPGRAPSQCWCFPCHPVPSLCSQTGAAASQNHGMLPRLTTHHYSSFKSYGYFMGLYNAEDQSHWLHNNTWLLNKVIIRAESKSPERQDKAGMARGTGCWVAWSLLPHKHCQSLFYLNRSARVLLSASHRTVHCFCLPCVHLFMLMRGSYSSTWAW